VRAGPAAAVLAVAEIIVFVLVAHATSWPSAVLLTIVTSLVGMSLATRAASRTVRDARRSGRAGGDGAQVSDAVADGAVAFVGSLLLVLPGFVTDAAGTLMVFRPTRTFVRRVVGRRIAGRVMRSRVVTVWPAGRPRPTSPADGHDVIEGDVIAPDRTPRRDE
jgi:UPF0716 protein FxsA